MEKKWYKKVSSWLTILFLIVVIPLMIIFGTIMVKAKIYPNKIPDFMGYKPLIVLSGSMEKEIRAGDLVIVKMVDNSTLKKNDVIAYRNSSNTATLHRIVDIKKEHGEIKYITKGDNNTIADNENVTNKNIEGLFCFKINGMGNILMFLQKPFGLLIVCIAIITIGISLTVYFNSKNKISISKEELEEFRKFKEQQQDNEII